MKLEVKITKEVLAEAADCGFRFNAKKVDISKSCAIAVALKKIFSIVMVSLSYVVIKEKGLAWNISLPSKAITFIMDFDNLGRVESTEKSIKSSIERRKNMNPISFEINLPKELIDSINIDDIHRCETLELLE